MATGALTLNDALGLGTPGSIDRAGVMPGKAPSDMLVPFTEDIVAKFPDQPGRASWQFSRSAVLEWVSRWRAENDANGEASPETWLDTGYVAAADPRPCLSAATATPANSPSTAVTPSPPLLWATW